MLDEQLFAFKGELSSISCQAHEDRVMGCMSSKQ
jgi:hypothetical protein